MKKVIVCGCFDLLHPGHLFFFKKAKKYGDYLIVLVARDEQAMQMKGEKPLFPEKTRMEMVASLRMVDEVVLGDKKNKYDGVLRSKPDVVVLGYDQKFDDSSLKKEIVKRGLKTRVVRLKKALHPDKYKSKILKKKLLRKR